MCQICLGHCYLKVLHTFIICSFVHAGLLKEEEMSVLVVSLKQLFQNPGCSLRDLSMSHVGCHIYVISMLSMCPTLQNLSLDICPPLNNTWKKQPRFPENIGDLFAEFE